MQEQLTIHVHRNQTLDPFVNNEIFFETRETSNPALHTSKEPESYSRLKHKIETQVAITRFWIMRNISNNRKLKVLKFRRIEGTLHDWYIISHLWLEKVERTVGPSPGIGYTTLGAAKLLIAREYILTHVSYSAALVKHTGKSNQSLRFSTWISDYLEWSDTWNKGSFGNICISSCWQMTNSTEMSNSLLGINSTGEMAKSRVIDIFRCACLKLGPLSTVIEIPLQRTDSRSSYRS